MHAFVNIPKIIIRQAEMHAGGEKKKRFEIIKAA